MVTTCFPDPGSCNAQAQAHFPLIIALPGLISRKKTSLSLLQIFSGEIQKMRNLQVTCLASPARQQWMHANRTALFIDSLDFYPAHLHQRWKQSSYRPRLKLSASATPLTRLSSPSAHPESDGQNGRDMRLQTRSFEKRGTWYILFLGRQVLVVLRVWWHTNLRLLHQYTMSTCRNKSFIGATQLLKESTGLNNKT